MNRRAFIILTAVSGLISPFPMISLAKEKLIIEPSGRDDIEAINSALKASARIGIPAELAKGVFIVSSTIVVPAGARLIGRGQLSAVTFAADATQDVIRIDKPHLELPVKQLYVEDRSSPIPFIAIIG